MKVLVILLCITISHVFGKLENRKAGEKNLRVNKDVMEDASSHIFVDDDKRPAIQVENLQGKYAENDIFVQIAANAKVEKKTSRNPSPVIETSTVKPGSSKAIKANLEIMYLRKPAQILRVLQNIANPKNTSPESGSKASVDYLKSFYWDTNTLRRDETNDERKLGLLRRKRRAADPEDRVLSYRAYNKLRRKLPLPMRLKIRETSLAEDYLLDYWVGAGRIDEQRLNAYNKTRYEELEELRKEVEAMGDEKQEFIDTYKALRKGVPWNYDKLRDKYKKFFGTTSPARTEYEAMKAKEHSWIDSFLDGSDTTKLAAAGPMADEKAEEMVRGVRAKETEMVEVGDAAFREDAEYVVATTDDAKVEVTNTGTTTTTTQTKNSSNLVRIIVMFALVMQVIIAILILGPEMSKLSEWCQRSKTEDDIIAAGEKEPLYAKKRTLQLGRSGKARRLPSTPW